MIKKVPVNFKYFKLQLFILTYTLQNVCATIIHTRKSPYIHTTHLMAKPGE